MLHGVYWQFVTNVLKKKNISVPSAGVKLPKKTGPACLTLEDETDTLFRKVGKEILRAEFQKRQDLESPVAENEYLKLANVSGIILSDCMRVTSHAEY
jgi:hypothetical protein